MSAPPGRRSAPDPKAEGAPETFRRVELSIAHEPSAWLREAVARRIHALESLGFDPHGPGPLFVVPLGEPTVPGTREDRECDRCGVYVPDGEMHLFAGPAARRLVLGGGLCSGCARREGWTA